MDAMKKTMLNYVRWLVRELEPIDSPGDRDKWCLQWDVNHNVRIGSGLMLAIKGYVDVSVDKIGESGVVNLTIDGGSLLTFKLVNKALRKEIIDYVKPMFGIVDTPKARERI